MKNSNITNIGTPKDELGAPDLLQTFLFAFKCIFLFYMVYTMVRKCMELRQAANDIFGEEPTAYINETKIKGKVTHHLVDPISHPGQTTVKENSFNITGTSTR